MKIALHDHENNGYPNVALMKLSAWHKAKGDSVEWFNAMFSSEYTRVYSSKVFTWTKPDPYLPDEKTVYGGTGYEIAKVLPDEIEHICPDYSLYDCNKSYGFLTRGCARSCPWCFVPAKEGKIRPHADIEEFCRHKEVVLMDNNILACNHGLAQIDKMINMGLKVDFNQGLDARLIDGYVARRLGKLRWIRHLRLACDTAAMIEPVRKAVELLRWHNCNPAQIFCYVLVQDIDDALERVRFLKGMYITPFAQPFRAPDGTEPSAEQKAFARWVNHKAIFKTTTWNEYIKLHRPA